MSGEGGGADGIWGTNRSHVMEGVGRIQLELTRLKLCLFVQVLKRHDRRKGIALGGIHLKGHTVRETHTGRFNKG